jgi:Protein of unknown function (DUF3096)
VSEDKLGKTATSSFGILRRRKTDPFRGPWKHPALQTRLTIAFSGGQVYVIGRSRIEKVNLSLGRSLHNRRCGLKLKEGVVSIALFSLLTTTALAQTGGTTFLGAITLRLTSFTPIVSLVAGILILAFPRLLRYVVGSYLILVGLLGLFGR